MNAAENQRLLKSLIKKYHPDLAAGDSGREALYTEITVKLTAALNRLKKAQAGKTPDASPPQGPAAAEEVPASAAEAPSSVADQAYAYYRLGIRYYKRIHPDKFFRKKDNGTYISKPYREQVEALNEIHAHFACAAYCFGKIAKDYAESEWAADARAKLALLKKLAKSYENIDACRTIKIIKTGKFAEEMGLRR